MALKRHPQVLTLIPKTAGPGDHIEQMLTNGLRRNAARYREVIKLFVSPMTRGVSSSTFGTSIIGVIGLILKFCCAP